MSELPEGYELRDGADPIAAHAVLTECYWAKGITLDKVQRSFAGSLQVSVWFGGAQVAMARLITDHATFAYLNDVYVLPAHEGNGLAKAMLAHLLARPDLQNLDRWALWTKDAQSLYAQFGWKQYPWPERMMIIDPKVFPE
jgi:GNAT superfamily N-acetyltransferase